MRCGHGLSASLGISRSSGASPPDMISSPPASSDSSCSDASASGRGLSTGPSQVFVWYCLLVVALSGCTTNSVIVVAPPVRPMVTGPSCWLPVDKDQHYLPPKQTAVSLPVASERAKVDHVSGCAAVIFQLTRDGKAEHITVLREFPADYGYAQAVSDSVRRSTFTPPVPEGAWYYLATSIGLGGPAPATPGPAIIPPGTVTPLKRS